MRPKSPKSPIFQLLVEAPHTKRDGIAVAKVPPLASTAATRAIKSPSAMPGAAIIPDTAGEPRVSVPVLVSFRRSLATLGS